MSSPIPQWFSWLAYPKPGWLRCVWQKPVRFLALRSAPDLVTLLTRSQAWPWTALKAVNEEFLEQELTCNK